LCSRCCGCLWKASLEETRRKGVRVLISLSVAKWNRPANALYEQHGVFALYERYGFTSVEEGEGTLL
jgi:ribosomal protein S18 acetylase RimI-like enzyme